MISSQDGLVATSVQVAALYVLGLGSYLAASTSSGPAAANQHQGTFVRSIMFTAMHLAVVGVSAMMELVCGACVRGQEETAKPASGTNKSGAQKKQRRTASNTTDSEATPPPPGKLAFTYLRQACVHGTCKAARRLVGC